MWTMETTILYYMYFSFCVLVTLYEINKIVNATPLIVFIHEKYLSSKQNPRRIYNIWHLHISSNIIFTGIVIRHCHVFDLCYVAGVNCPSSNKLLSCFKAKVTTEKGNDGCVHNIIENVCACFAGILFPS